MLMTEAMGDRGRRSVRQDVCEGAVPADTCAQGAVCEIRNMEGVGLCMLGGVFETLQVGTSGRELDVHVWHSEESRPVGGDKWT